MNFKLKSLKKIKLKHLSVILMCGILILTFPSVFQRNENDDKKNTVENTSFDISANEERLCKIISKIRGVSDVSVFITYENLGVKKAGINSSSDISLSNGSSSTSSDEKAIMKKQSSVEEPFITEEVMPKVRGVLVVAHGAENKSLNVQITEAVSSVLGVAIHRVRVLPAN